jgi:hypothetical protein
VLSRDGRVFHSFPYNRFAAKVTETITGSYEDYEGISYFEWGIKAHFKLIIQKNWFTRIPAKITNNHARMHHSRKAYRRVDGKFGRGTERN